MTTKAKTAICPRVVLECAHADTCLPDYWCGHHRPHISVHVWRGMTLRQLKQALRDEVRQGAVMGNDDDARMLSAGMVRPCEESRADALTRAAYAAIERIKLATPRKRPMFPDLEYGQYDDVGEMVYCYFVFLDITPDYMKSMYFLRMGGDYLDDAKPYATKQAAIEAYAETARELARYGQTTEASIHVAESFDDLQEYPDFALSLGKRGGVKIEPC